MKVVFLEDVEGVAHGGDVKEVKNGFARNFLIPKQLAVPATHNALQRIESLAKDAEVERLKSLSDMKALAELLDGVQVNVEMRAGVGGRLYGSVTNAIVAEKLSEMTDMEIDRRTIPIEEPIRDLGTYHLSVNLHPDVAATIKVLVYATGTNPMAVDEESEEGEAEAEEVEGEVEETVAAESDSDDEPVAEVTDAPEATIETAEADAEDESVAEANEDEDAEDQDGSADTEPTEADEEKEG